MNDVELTLLKQMHEEVCSKIEVLSDTVTEHIKKYEKHVESDMTVHQAVGRHTMYFQGFSILLGAAWAAFLAWFRPGAH